MFTVGNKISGTYSHLRFEGVIVDAVPNGMIYVEVEAPVKNLPATYNFTLKKRNILSFHVNETDPAKGRGNVVIDQPPAPAPAPVVTLTADELAVLEIIEMGWYTYLKTESKDDTAGRLWGKNLTDYTPTGLDMQINADGIAVLDLLDPNRTTKTR